MTTVERAIDYAIDAMRAGELVTEEVLQAEFPSLSSYGAEAARRAAEDATAEPVARGALRSKGTTFCTSDRALQHRKAAEDADRAAASLPRTKFQGRKR